MSRTLAGFDRFLVLVIGLLLIAVGVGGLIWQLNFIDRLPDTLSASWLSRAATQTWWAWAVGAAGVVLVLLGLRWMLAHLPGRGVRHVRLGGSSSAGRLTADLTSVAATAADVLGETPGVSSTSSSTSVDRGLRTISLTATIDPTIDLARVGEAADRVVAELGGVLGDESIATRVHVHVAKASPGRSRPA